MKESMIGFSDVIALTGDEQEKRVAPNEFTFVPYGEHVKFTRGGTIDEYTCDENDADTIISEFNSRGKDLVLDWDHATLNKAESSVGNAPASGWIKELKKGADGIVAVMRRWTPKAAEQIAEDAYRYFSPVLDLDRKTKRPVSIHSGAITNHPAIHGIKDLVAANDLAGEQAEKPTEPADPKLFDESKQVIIALKDTIDEMKEELITAIAGLKTLAGEDEGLQTEVTALSDGLFVGQEKKDNPMMLLGAEGIKLLELNDDAKRSEITSKITAMNDKCKAADDFLGRHKEKDFDTMTMRVINTEKSLSTKEAEIKNRIAMHDAERAVEDAMFKAPGKITEAMKPWAIQFAKKDLVAFNDFIANSPYSFQELSDTTRKELRDGGNEETIQHFSDDQLEIAKLMAHDPKEIYSKKAS